MVVAKASIANGLDRKAMARDADGRVGARSRKGDARNGDPEPEQAPRALRLLQWLWLDGRSGGTALSTTMASLERDGLS